MSAGREKTESQLERAYGELEAIRERKADILEKEKNKTSNYNNYHDYITFCDYN